MGFYRQRILPHIIEWVMNGKAFSEQRQRILEHLQGEVLEIGFGTGLNLPFYPPTVKEIIAVDAVEFDRKYLESHRKASSPVVHLIQSRGETLPLNDQSVDHVVTTWTLCSVDNPAQVLSEIKRVLKPGGTYVFVEHGKSSERHIAKLQDWLTPIQKRIGGGCHLNREIDKIIFNSGLKVKHLEQFYMKGMKVGTYLYFGETKKDVD